jgi:hypothetical protein
MIYLMILRKYLLNYMNNWYLRLALRAFSADIFSKRKISTAHNRVVNAAPRVRAARPSATRPFGRSASGTFSLADARENVVNNKR